MELFSDMKGIAQWLLHQMMKKKRILLEVENEKNTNSDTRGKLRYIHQFVIKMHWFQKL